jgi:hypothetical protein
MALLANQTISNLPHLLLFEIFSISGVRIFDVTRIDVAVSHSNARRKPHEVRSQGLHFSGKDRQTNKQTNRNEDTNRAVKITNFK